MLAKVISGATIGLQTFVIEVEVDVTNQGLYRFNIVGLPDKAVEESKERVISAIKNSGASFPNHRITVNLAPADIPKAGPSYDLPIAIGILHAHGELNADISSSFFLGEVSLDGSLRHTQGILPLTMLAQQAGYQNIYLPAVDAIEASVVPNISIIPVKSLAELISCLRQQTIIETQSHTRFSNLLSDSATYQFDFADVRGQEQAKRALEIAAAGHHNIMLHGVPGAGKTLLTRALPSIMPTMSEQEALEVTKIYSITGNLPPEKSLITHRPFRSPHHTTSRIGLIGGGSYPSPGEISLAHRGILFLDELPEFPRDVLESLRQPMEDGLVTISRAAGTIQFPAKFLMVAAANPCPCGYHGSQTRTCTCQPSQISRYQKKLSGPLLDRIDLHVHVTAVEIDKLTQTVPTENSTSIRDRVEQARQRQLARFKSLHIASNGEMTSKQVTQYCQLDSPSQTLIKQAVKNLSLTARSYFRLIKVARTIADLEQSPRIESHHLAEALQYRTTIHQ